MVNVGGGDPERLRSGGPELLGEVVVAHPDVDGVARSNDASI